MSRYAIKFPFRVRIHGGEFDESARAIHREDGLKTIQAESGIVLESTIERKQMSTKTTFKRIALVTVAALGFGVMSVAPSSAAVLADTYTLSESTTTVSLGSPASVTLTTAGYFGATTDSATVTVALKTWPTTLTAAQIGTSLAAPGVFSDVDTATAYTGGSAGGSSALNATVTSVTGVAGTAPKLVSTRSKVTVAAGSLPVIGTYTFTLTPSGGSNTTALTWTVVVNARPAMTAAATTVYANYAYYDDAVNVAIRGAWAAWSTTTDALTLSAYAAPSDAPSASIKVVQGNGNTTYPLIAADAVALTATVTGPANVAISGEGAGYSGNLGAKGIYATTTSTQLTNLGLTQYVYVYSTGAPGLVSVEIKAGSTVLSTEKIQFFGAAATITSTAAKAVIGAANTAAVVTGVVKDASGNAVPGVAVYAVSDTVAAISNSYTACTSTDALGAYSCSVTGVAAGTAKITTTLNSSATGTSAVSATPVSVRVSDGVVTKVDYAFAEATYAPGAAASITATLSNAAGPMPAGTYTVATAAVTGNYTLSGTPGTSITTTDATGVVKYAVTVPTGITGSLTLTGTAATGVTATYGTALVVNAALDAAQEASDYAQEAIDAGIAAKDSADLALEAADAATIAAEMAAEAATEAGLVAVAAAEAAGEIATEALDAANAATDAALSAAEAADAATAAATEAKESADAATAAVAALSTEVAKLMAALNAKITTLSNLVAKIAKKVKA